MQMYFCTENEQIVKIETLDAPFTIEEIQNTVKSLKRNKESRFGRKCG